ncbi:glycosyl transferases group 1 [Clostridium homopropionicum DSM 5847]|uniref:Glycosyl transferases group 1 n=1 Tax=Clostridium homopropionicum DSM 5847 TaxID=1121318 RepID=A0A0L6ZC90_9CLOT|nr:glycosyltransferase [Clostridium homopropionicum]KOA20581.1 glycosyl transferases group 1 [Clostridium homopropionicum DSM 5847]SFF93903.1 Glycosyltransferase involved in cell wall bisynthesis [Clostridium homopropionicum]
MKILFITPNNINEKNGGGINVKKLYLGLKSFESSNILIYSPSKLKESCSVAKKNKIYDILSRTVFHSNYLYINWKIDRHKLLRYRPDIIILSNSRLGFIAKDIRKKNNDIRIITQLDNIEYDYCENYVEKYYGLKKIFIKLIEKISVSRDENSALKFSDKLIFLTERDRKRAHKLYNYSNSNEFILPICLEKSNIKLVKNNMKLNLVFLASLWYAPNYNGILWFIKEVWNKINFIDMNLIIGGNRPNEELIKFNGINNIYIYANFNRIEDIVPQNSIFISPIFQGAGMKVKVAEALSLGLAVIATKESLVGYEEALNDNENEVIFEANNSSEFINLINNVINKKNDYCLNENNAKYIFNKYYSIERVVEQLDSIVEIS